MRYLLIAVALLGMAVLLVSEADPGKAPAVADPEYQVQNLVVNDIDLDDGSGLQLSWTPLPKDKSVIEYRIYRGVSPDSMFQVGAIPVSAKLGVISKELVFFDKDYTEVASVNSPAKLAHEKGQPKGSPLYRKMPRDMKVYAPLLKKYSPLAVINKDQFYFHTKKTTKIKPKPDTKTAEQDTTVLAGMKLYQFEVLLAKLKPGQKYYYAITAVDSRGKVHSPCATISGTPVDNPPAVITPFYAVRVDDAAGTPKRLQFEWEQQLFKDDVSTHSIYAVKRQDSLAFATYLDYQRKHNAWVMDNSLHPDSPSPDSLPPVPNPASLIWRSPSSYPYDSPNIAAVTVTDGKIDDPDNGIHFTYDPAQEYFFVFSIMDYAGFETFSAPSGLDKVAENTLPVLPEYEVVDMPNDQGEYMQVNFGRPLAYISKTSFGSTRQQLVVNYDFAVNSHYKISNIYFKFYNKGQQIAEVNEYFLDRIIRVNLAGVDVEKDNLEVKISFRTTKTPTEPGYELTQTLSYDPETLQMMPGELCYKEERIDRFRYYVLKRNQNAAEQRLAKRLGPLSRVYNDNISYETSIFSGIDDYDLKKNLLLVSPMTDFLYSSADSMNVYTNIYPDEAVRDLRGYETQAKTLRDSLAKVTDPALKAGLEEQIKFFEKFVATTRNHPLVKQMAAIKGLHARNKFLRKYREESKRTFEYVFVKSDGKGHFTMSDTFKRDGQSYFLPKSEYFDKTSVPMLIATLIFGILVWYYIARARRGHDLYVRPISGLSEVDNAIGRATEMGRPILFVPGLSSIDDVATLAALAILGHVARRVATYDTRLIVPVCDYIVLPISQEIVRTAYYEVGRPDGFNPQDVFFTAAGQFPYVASVNGIMIREKTATNFYMGMFYAEALIMTETGSQTGAIQIAGTDAITQIPFFITTCDYTLIGEELYAASAYLSREPLILGTLKAQDYTKFLIVAFIVVGTFLSTAHATFLINAFPEK